MKLKLFLFFALSVILLFSLGCSPQKSDEQQNESTPAVTEDTTENTTAPTDTTTRPIPPTPPIATTFTDIRTMKSELEAESKSHQIDLPALKELAGLDEGYTESHVEWSGDLECLDYCIYYVKEDAAVAFIPFSSEEDLQIHMTNLLNSSGTYEFLIANPKVSNVQKTEITTEIGIAYECSYDTSLKTGLKIRYYEYTDPASDITYILSESFDSNGSLQSSDLFVFDGENSFMCNCLYTSLTISEAMELSSKTVN